VECEWLPLQIIALKEEKRMLLDHLGSVLMVAILASVHVEE
jgi:hypothetical protein